MNGCKDLDNEIWGQGEKWRTEIETRYGEKNKMKLKKEKKKLTSVTDKTRDNDENI